MLKTLPVSLFVLAFMVAGVASLPQTASAMNKAELIEAIASEAGLSKADSKKALDGFLDATTKALKKGDRLSLIGFGSFSISMRSARTGRNPQTGKERKTLAKTVDFFPEVRSTAAERRHDGITVTGEDIVADVCGDRREREDKCPYALALDALLTVTVDAYTRGETVEWGDFGSFSSPAAESISKRSARTGRNPQTGKEIQIAAKNVVKFKAGAELSKSVN